MHLLSLITGNISNSLKKDKLRISLLVLTPLCPLKHNKCRQNKSKMKPIIKRRSPVIAFLHLYEYCALEKHTRESFRDIKINKSVT